MPQPESNINRGVDAALKLSEWLKNGTDSFHLNSTTYFILDMQSYEVALIQFGEFQKICCMDMDRVKAELKL